MNIDKILNNEVGITAIDAMPMMADVISGVVAAPTHYPESTPSLSAWLEWFRATSAYRALNILLTELGVDNVLRGDRIWQEDGYLLPDQAPHCGPCQFEFSGLISAGSAGGCIALICSAPGRPGFCAHIGVNEDGTRLLIWPENVGLSEYQGVSDFDGWVTI